MEKGNQKKNYHGKAMCHGESNLPIDSLNNMSFFCAQCMVLYEITWKYMSIFRD